MRTAVKELVEFSRNGSGRSRKRNAREERGASHTDVGVGRTQNRFGRRDIGTSEQHFARDVGCHRHLRLGDVHLQTFGLKFCRHFGAHKRRQRIAILCDRARGLDGGGLGRCHRLHGLLHFKHARSAELVALLD